MKQTTILSASLALLSSAFTAQAADVIGKGTIAVLNGTDFDGLTIDQKVGCINAKGAVTLDDCATFTVLQPAESGGLVRLMSSEAGLCTFQNQDQPVNEDSELGQEERAWACYKDHPDTEWEEPYYTINGLAQPFVCTGNINCFYDLKGEPASEEDEHPVWPFSWGAEQTEVAPGHLQVAWLWQPVAGA